jgi:hypothetical protein
MNHLPTWLATIALLVVAGIVSAITPADDAEVAAFIVTGEIGEPVTGRDIVATVTDARTSTSVTGAAEWSGDEPWTSEGNWLVVDVDVASVTGPRVMYLTGAVTLDNAVFVLDGREYRATERTPSMLDERLNPGVPRHGSLAFELPVLSGTGVLQLATSTDTRMDSVLEIPIDLDALSPLSETEVIEPEWKR